MEIITPNVSINTDTDCAIFIFKDDNELNQFLSKIATTPVKTSGARVLSLIPNNKVLSPLQSAILSVIDGLDGACSKDAAANEKLIDGAIDGVNDIIENY